MLCVRQLEDKELTDILCRFIRVSLQQVGDGFWLKKEYPCFFLSPLHTHGTLFKFDCRCGSQDNFEQLLEEIRVQCVDHLREHGDCSVSQAPLKFISEGQLHMFLRIIIAMMDSLKWSVMVLTFNSSHWYSLVLRFSCASLEVPVFSLSCCAFFSVSNTLSHPPFCPLFNSFWASCRARKDHSVKHLFKRCGVTIDKFVDEEVWSTTKRPS